MQPTTPLKDQVTLERTGDYTRRSIQVKREGDSYRVDVVDVVSTNTQNHGLLTGDKSEETAQSSRLTQFTGVNATLEKANAKALAMVDKLLLDGWKASVPKRGGKKKVKK